MEALGINLGFLLVQIVGFLIVLIVLNQWVYKPVLGLLERRRMTIAQGLEDARVASEARANAEKQAEKVLADAQAKAAEMVREATERAEAVSAEMKASAEAEADKIVDEAKTDAEREKERMLAELRPQVITLAMSAAQKLVGEALDETRQHQLLSEFFSGVKSGKVVVLEKSNVSGASAEVVSALPLTKEEQETVKKDLLSEVGSQTVTFRVDPSILGGIIVKVGDRVLDGSVAGQLVSLQQKLS